MGDIKICFFGDVDDLGELGNFFYFNRREYVGCRFRCSWINSIGGRRML